MNQPSVKLARLDMAVCRFLETRDVHRLSEEILACLEFLGYAHTRQAMAYEDFELIAQQLGSIILRTELAITADRKSIVYKPDEIGFHQDNPTIHFIGWYCVHQDEMDGSSRLLDTDNLVTTFSSDELEVLSTINIRYPDLANHQPDLGREAYFQAPLLDKGSAGYGVYFTPWFLLDSYDEQQRRVLDKFIAYVKAKETHEVIGIRLKPGESLFINNRRMLHGREAIRPDSRRFIKRVWIRRPA
jgi:hypothetical protein